MFIKLTKSGPRRYLQLAESYRDENGKVKQRTLASLGRLEAIDANFDTLVSGLERVNGRSRTTLSDKTKQAEPTITYESARSVGNVWSLTALWKELGFDQLANVFRQSSRRRFDVEGLLRLMVLNRLCDPESNLGVLRWLKTVFIPGMDTADIQHQHLLRAMDALMDVRSRVDEVIASLLRPLVDIELSVVFYDLTTIRAEGLSEQSG